MIQLIKRQDWLLNSSLAILALASLLTIASASPNLFWRQIFFFLSATLIVFILSLIDWRLFSNDGWIIYGIYGVSVGLLVATYFFAPVVRQTRSWLFLGPIQFQTAEFAKLSLILLFSYFFAKRHVGIAHLKNIFIPLILAAIPIGLVLLQPDLGTAIILTSIWVGFLFVSGLRWRHIFIGAFLFAICAVVGWNYFLKDYQKERIAGFLRPEYDPLGINYSVIQAKIAIGSAGFWGKGFGQGTQVQLGFLTEANADFIFSAFFEEWGFLGGLALIGAFFLVVWRILRIGMRSENNFSKLICLGVAILFLAQFVLNVWSNIGLFPVVGVNLPFVSYGGSNLLTMAVLIGIIQSIAVRRMF